MPVSPHFPGSGKNKKNGNVILWGLGFPVRRCFGKNTKPHPEGENPQKLPLPFYLLVIQMGVGASLPSVPRVPSAWIPALPCGRVKHCFFSFSEVLCCLFKAMSYFFSTFFSPLRWLNSLWQEPWPLFFFLFINFVPNTSSRHSWCS